MVMGFNRGQLGWQVVRFMVLHARRILLAGIGMRNSVKSENFKSFTYLFLLLHFLIIPTF
ncbi:hypothetical protein Bca4012_051377 [Brassica carinata]|uniref:Uncharacterized protein n=1 Tax=Brassica oleracea var. oleracea TaxID=109376 RepID=A0A0D2ZYS4_BRAOL